MNMHLANQQLLFLIILGLLIACDNDNFINNKRTTQDNVNDTISSPIDHNTSNQYLDDILGTWEISDYVYYLDENNIKNVYTIPPLNNGKSLRLEEIDGIDDLLLTLKYANILNTYCKIEQNNFIKINNEWGGTELFDSTGEEEKLINLMNNIDLWVVINENLYLIDSKTPTNYNAICLKKDS